MRSELLIYLFICSVIVLAVQAQEDPDPCEDVKKELEELQKKIDENTKKLDDIIRKLEEEEQPGENPDNPDEKPGEKPGEGEKPSDNPVKDSLTDEEWAALVEKLKKEAAAAVEHVKKWLGPGGVAFWGCIDPVARQVLTELMLYLGPKEFTKQFDDMKGKNYKAAAEIIRKSRWGRENRKKADELAKRLEEIKGPINPPDKRAVGEVLDLDQCWPEGSFRQRPGLPRWRDVFDFLRRPVR